MLEHLERAAVGQAVVEHGDDVAVVELGGDASLVEEHAPGLVVGDVGQEALERDPALPALFPQRDRLEHLGHATGADPTHHAIATDLVHLGPA